MAKELEKIIFDVSKRNSVEGRLIGSVVIPIIKLHDYDVYVYGGGRDIEWHLAYFARNDVQVKAVIDCDVKKKGVVVDNVPYVMPEDFPKCVKNPQNSFVIITTKFWYGLEQMDIMSVITSAGINKFYVLPEDEKIEATGGFPGWLGYFRKNVEKLQCTYEMLYDQESHDIMKEYLRCIVQRENYMLEHIDSRKKYFYGENNEELYSHLDDEVWLNCGANIGDSIFLYFLNNLKAKAVYAYEGDPEIYAKLKANIRYLPEKQQASVKLVNEFINSGSKFENIEEKITFLNADIEGYELELLMAMRDRIIQDRPVMAICVYHKMEDLVEIPQFISSIVSDYDFVLRKYESTMLHIRRNQELVLYMIPKERRTLNQSKCEL